MQLLIHALVLFLRKILKQPPFLLGFLSSAVVAFLPVASPASASLPAAAVAAVAAAADQTFPSELLCFN